MKKLILLVRKYFSYARYLYRENSTNFERFKSWMHTYISYKTNESKFSSTYLPKYEQGQILFLDFGCGIGSEFSYPHYAVVINSDDMKKNPIITVMPLTSKKAKHNVLMPWEHELTRPVPSLLAEKAFNNFDLDSEDYKTFRLDLIELMNHKKDYTDDQFKEKYTSLVDKGVELIVSTNQDIMTFRDKMKEGSIVETNHIRTIDKARIKFPDKRTHPLYGIRISDSDLANILYLHTSHTLPKNIDKLIEENV
nr:MAG TPA: PemK-like protein [Caudoviricetes sp.]